MSKHSSGELLDIYEILLKAQLDAISRLKEFRDSEDSPVSSKQKRSGSKSKSQMDIVYDILIRCDEPLHINEIIGFAKEWYDISLDRESLVSALTKKVKRGERFIRTKPNTFGIASKEGAR